MNSCPTAQMSPGPLSEEFELAKSAVKTMSGHDENVEALLYRCMRLWGETDYVSSYDMW